MEIATPLLCLHQLNAATQLLQHHDQVISGERLICSSFLDNLLTDAQRLSDTQRQNARIGT